jgi:hypothetical protein
VQLGVAALQMRHAVLEARMLGQQLLGGQRAQRGYADGAAAAGEERGGGRGDEERHG